MHIKEHQLDYYRVATKLVHLLGRKFGVAVQMGNYQTGATNGRTVFLPHYNLEDPKLRIAFYGLIAHEGGGHIAQTDFKMLGVEANAMKKSKFFNVWKSMQNILEDVRIERNLMRQYPGIAPYLNACVDVVLLSAEPDTDHDQYWVHVVNWCLICFRHDCLGQTALAGQKAAMDAVLDQLCSAASLQQARGIAAKAASFGPDKAATQDVCALANQLLGIFIKTAPSQQPDESDSSDQADGQDRQQGKGDSSGQADGQDQQQGKGDSSGQADGQDQQQGKGDSSGQADGQRSRSVCEDPLKEEMGNIHARLAEIGSVDDGELPIGIIGGVNDLYLNDTLKPVHPLLRRSLAMRSTLTAALAPLITGDANVEIRKPNGASLDARRLARVKTERDPLIFKRLLIEDDEALSICLLVDRSTSTEKVCGNGSTVLVEEQTAALGLAAALEAYSSTETCILHFPANNGVQVSKHFDTPLLQSGLSWPSAAGGTPLHEAMMAASLQFFSATYERKLLIVLTDGEPDDPKKAEEAKQFAKSLGIEVFGIVVATPKYPKQLFDDSIQIDTAADLSSALSELVMRVI